MDLRQQKAHLLKELSKLDSSMQQNVIASNSTIKRFWGIYQGFRISKKDGYFAVWAGGISPVLVGDYETILTAIKWRQD